MSIIFLDEGLAQRLEKVGQREATSTLDGTIAVLLDGYQWLHRGGSISPLQPKVVEAEVRSAQDGCPRPWAIRQETARRLVAIDQAKAAKGLEQVVEGVLSTYEWLMQGGLSKELVGCVASDPAGVWMKVDAQLKACLEEIGEEEGCGSDEALVMLLWSYDWLYRSGVLEQVKALASTALSWFELDDGDRQKIEGAMGSEEPAGRFRVIQDLYLQHARELLQKGKERASDPQPCAMAVPHQSL